MDQVGVQKRDFGRTYLHWGTRFGDSTSISTIIIWSTHHTFTYRVQTKYWQIEGALGMAVAAFHDGLIKSWSDPHFVSMARTVCCCIFVQPNRSIACHRVLSIAIKQFIENWIIFSACRSRDIWEEVLMPHHQLDAVWLWRHRDRGKHRITTLSTPLKSSWNRESRIFLCFMADSLYCESWWTYWYWNKMMAGGESSHSSKEMSHNNFEHTVEIVLKRRISRFYQLFTEVDI